MVLPPTPGAPMMSPIRDRAIDSRLKVERATWWGRAGKGPGATGGLWCRAVSRRITRPGKRLFLSPLSPSVA